MSLVELNLNKPPNRRSVNFTDRNSVEAFLQTGRFRPCANLKCSPGRLAHDVLYMPVCSEGCFNKEGIGQCYDMPLPRRRLGRLTYVANPVTYTAVGVWGPLVSCPCDCTGYRNRTVAKIQTAGSGIASWSFENILKPADILWAAFWAWVFK
jgi:hypothetical protein